MPTSQNGWSASPDLALRPLVIDGVGFVPGIRDDDDVHTVLEYVMTQYHQRVEPLKNPGCWGYNYRANANNPNALSNHSSGTAIDANAPQHPNGVPTQNTFTLPQINEIHQILGEVDHTIRWGGDYTVTPDAMHFEVNTDKQTLAAVANRLRNQEDEMNKQQEDLLKKVLGNTETLLKQGDRRQERNKVAQQRLLKRIEDLRSLAVKDLSDNNEIKAALDDLQTEVEALSEEE